MYTFNIDAFTEDMVWVPASVYFEAGVTTVEDWNKFVKNFSDTFKFVVSDPKPGFSLLNFTVGMDKTNVKAVLNRFIRVTPDGGIYYDCSDKTAFDALKSFVDYGVDRVWFS